MDSELDFFEISKANTETLEKERAIVHYISTPDIDRGGDIVNPKGIITNDFDNTRTVFYNHNYYMPIAKNLWHKSINDGVRAKTVFSETEFANDIYTLHKEDVINTWSIGFDIPRKAGRYSEPIDGAIEYDEKTRVRKINKWILYEYSSAPLAMNPNCLDQAKTLCKSIQVKGFIEKSETQLDLRKILDEQNQTIKKLNETILELDEKLKSNSSEDLTGIKSEIENIKKDLQKKTVESLEKHRKPRVQSHEVAQMFLGELSRITGKRYKLS